ncbi:GNAT family N-acetyltransferase [Paenibacillus ehimensis]|uniref:GNAT family N-acetyltransferase n=1 Tax=Paenibacillus ehimensis TaxID=79264 RepID=A0ABT8VJ31_9BACL|nr:GNAT family N-acetyltransferase [Paenibacillus ehimensis]MDO3680983.1 GNAT family N-acetyltransferase [Paenibacillus ehimensis]
MDIVVSKAAVEQKSVVRNLLELYKYDFTEFDPEDVNEHGLFEYPYLDHYWTEEGRHAFLVHVDGKLAGLALIRELGSDERVYSVAEFFVMKKYRRHGVGREMAFALFNRFPGQWEVAQMEENVPAQMFWKRIIDEYTKGSYEEITRDDWEGPIQTFRSAP